MFSKYISSEDAPFCSGQGPVCYMEQKKPWGIYTNSEDFVPCFCQLKLELPLILTKDTLLLLWLGIECNFICVTLLQMLDVKRGLQMELKILQSKHWTAWAAENLLRESLAPLK